LDTDNGAAIVHLVDITPVASWLISEAPISVQRFLFLNAEPGQVNGLAEVYFNAQYLWCKKDYIP
jgi:hypothetical protein